MLDRTRKKLESYFKHEPMLGADGQMHEMDRVTQINSRQCEALAELHKSIKPDLSIETGLAYGFSSLPILDAMEEHGYGHHIAIDPGQMNYWHGVALTAIDELELSKRFTWIGARSDVALPQLIAERKRAQFIFFDGLHTFENVMTDVCLADQLLDVGGLLIVNDMWLPSIRAIASYIETNLAHFEKVPASHENIFVVRKRAQDGRAWDHFAPFNSAGSEPSRKGVLGRLFGG